ncbi:hypothetical protein QF038_000031 [Pseudarthrobacter sp. W1I19]|nr:hypothetical protein [Pseudarthrobacter sp. W1I19]
MTAGMGHHADTNTLTEADEILSLGGTSDIRDRRVPVPTPYGRT